MYKRQTPKSLVFLRLKGDKQQKSSVFTRIKIGGQIRKLIARAGHELCVQLLGEVNELQSSIPSRMERISALDIKTDGPLKVKRCTPVITSYEASSNSKEKIKENGQASSHPITVRDANDLKAETGTAKALETSENNKRLLTWPNKWQVLGLLLPLKSKCLTTLSNKSLNYSSKKRINQTKNILLVGRNSKNFEQQKIKQKNGQLVAHKSINCE